MSKHFKKPISDYATKIGDSLDYSKMHITDESVYSSLLPGEGVQVHAIIAPYCANPRIIVDMNSNVGIDTLNFADKFSANVVAIELNPDNYAVLLENIDEFHYTFDEKKPNQRHIRAINGGCLDYLRKVSPLTHAYGGFVYYDPPWGGRAYKSSKYMNLYLSGIPISKVVEQTLYTMSDLAVVKVPRNFDMKAFKKNITGFISVDKHPVTNRRGKIAYNLLVCERITGKVFETVPYYKRQLFTSYPSINPQSPRVRGAKKATEIYNTLLKSGAKHKDTLNSQSYEKYIDIGAGDGAVVEGMARFLNKDNIYAADIPEWAGKPHPIGDHYLEIKVDNHIDLPDQFVDIVSILQVMHHVENLATLLPEIARICKPTGILVIKEHNVISKATDISSHVEHLRYNNTLHEMSPVKFAQSYYGNYKSKLNWSYILAQYGFEEIYYEQWTNKSNYFIAVYQLRPSRNGPSIEHTRV